MQELFRFYYHNRYLGLLYDGQKTYYAAFNNQGISFSLSPNEKALIKFIYKEIWPKSLKQISNLSIDNHIYAHLWDNKNNVHVFYEIKDNKYIYPEENILKKLNRWFNNENAYVSSNETYINNNHNYFQRIIKVGKKAIIVFVATSVFLGFNYLNNKKNIEIDDIPLIGYNFKEEFEENDYANLLSEIYIKYPNLMDKEILIKEDNLNIVLYFDDNKGYVNYEIVDDLDGWELSKQGIPDEIKNIFKYKDVNIVLKRKINLNYDDIRELINNNPRLSQEEKDFIIDNNNFIEDNLIYMDHNYLKDMLTNLKIEYIKDKDEYYAGEYYPFEYKIVLYNTSNFKEANKAVLTHELCHAFSNSYAGKWSKIFEGFNTIINNEYFGNEQEYDLGYQNLTDYAYLLLELINPETIKEAYFQSNITPLIKPLEELGLKEEDIEELFNNYDILYNPEMPLSLKKDASLKVISILKNLNINNNEEIAYFLNRREFVHDLVSSEYAENVVKTIKHKNYFLNNDMDNNYTIIEISSYNENHELEKKEEYALNYGLLENNRQR